MLLLLSHRGMLLCSNGNSVFGDALFKDIVESNSRPGESLRHSGQGFEVVTVGRDLALL
jgi:hypothetical protein